jgi:hypothetical protein
MDFLKFSPNLYPEIAILFGYWYKSAQSMIIMQMPASSGREGLFSILRGMSIGL